MFEGLFDKIQRNKDEIGIRVIQKSNKYIKHFPLKIQDYYLISLARGSCIAEIWL